MDALSAQLSSSRLLPASPPALNRREELLHKTVDQVADDVLRSFVFPDPDSIVLPRMDVSRIPPTRVFARAMAQAGVAARPGGDSTQPYFLLHEWDQKPYQLQALQTASLAKNVVVFAASGMGKTRLLLQLLRNTPGMFFVWHGSRTKNEGSVDVRDVCDLITNDVELLLKAGEENTRPFATRGFRALLAARIIFRSRWQAAAKKPVGAEQWTLAQLHPSTFLPYVGIGGGTAPDIFAELATQIYLHASSSSLGLIRADGYRWVLDEAQAVSSILPKTFPSRTDKEVKRSLLACFVGAVEAVGGRAVLAGTGLSMIDALEIATSGAAAAAALDDMKDEQLFRDFRPFTMADVSAFAERAGVGGEMPQPALAMLEGRPRFTTLFLDALANLAMAHEVRAGAAPHHRDQVVNLLQQYYDRMTSLEGHSVFTAGGIVQRVLNDNRLTNALGLMVPVRQGRYEKVRNAASELQSRAWAVVCGHSAPILQSEAMALVETGVVCDSSGSELRLERLFLEAFRKSCVSSDFLQQRLCNSAKLASALGSEFEDVVAYTLGEAVFPVDNTVPVSVCSALNGGEGGGGGENARILASRALWGSLDGVWRTFPVRLGRIMERCDLVEWFHRTLRIVRDPCSVEAGWMVTACAPDNNAGPDLAFFVRRWSGVGADGSDRYDAIGLVLVQDKLAMDVDEVDASLRLDPRLLYHRNRASAPAPLANQAEGVRALVEELHDVAVFRVLVSGVEGAGRDAKSAAERAGVIASAVKAYATVSDEATTKTARGEKLAEAEARAVTDALRRREVAATVRATVEAAAAASTKESKTTVAMVRHGRPSVQRGEGGGAVSGAPPHFPNDAYVALRPSALAQVLGVETAELVKALKVSRSSYD